MADLVDVTTLPAWPRRPAEANKGTFGRVLILAGSRGMSGAALLAGLACLRGGAGLVRVATPRDAQPLVALGSPCLMTQPLPQDADGRFDTTAFADWIHLASAHDVVALGPGLGRSPVLDDLVPRFLASLDRPLVLDADGLNACVASPGGLKHHRAPVIVTPHPGEFARLAGVTVAEVQQTRRARAVRFAGDHGIIVLLKGHGTIVTDGRRVYTNATGNPGMATAGSGDVLTGLLAALVGQGFDPFDAAVLGAHLHGLAGDLVRARLGEVGLIATDLIDALPLAIRQHQQGAFS